MVGGVKVLQQVTPVNKMLSGVYTPENNVYYPGFMRPMTEMVNTQQFATNVITLPPHVQQVWIRILNSITM